MMAFRTTSAVGLAVRAFIFSFGLVAIIWGIYTLPIFWRQAGMERLANHITAGDPFKANILTALIPQLDALQAENPARPGTLKNAAVIRLRILEQATVDADTVAADRQMTELRAAIGKSLQGAPADPFLWLVYFWLENTQKGFSGENLKYLRMSYSLGPNEGWVAVKRNRLALALFSQLSPELSESAITEFASLVDSRFFNEAANILIGPGWQLRDILLPRLKDVAEVNRQLFAKTVYRLGYDISVPGVEPRDQRPWH